MPSPSNAPGPDVGGRHTRRQLRVAADAVEELGTALLAHPNNEPLRAALRGGRLDEGEYYRELLALTCRLLFLRIATERGLPCPSHGLWQRLRRAFELPRGHLPTGQAVQRGSDSLFDPMACPHLEPASCGDAPLAQLLHHLAIVPEGDGCRSVDFAALEVEALGSLYEALLQYRPHIELHDSPCLRLIPGRERKRTGSYYTPRELIGELIERTLVPVMQERLGEERTPAGKERALLGLRVCDPACGSGHFLLAAARRLAQELAGLRSAGTARDAEIYRSALHDVIGSCLFAVDRDPLAVDLCRTALWLEARNPTLPLTFLDSRVKCGDSLILFRWPLEFPEVFEAGGFDVVLGNPPYGAKLLEGERRLIRETLPLARTSMNTAVAFLQRARELVRKGGRLGMVVPRSLTFSGEWEGIRSHLFGDAVALVDASHAFGGVRLEQVLLTVGTEPVERVQTGRLGETLQTLDKAVWSSLGAWVTRRSDLEEGILQRVSRLPRLGDLVRVYRGAGLQRSLAADGELAAYGGNEVGVFRLLAPRGRIAEAALGRAAPRLLLPKVMAQNVVAHVRQPRPHAWVKAAIDWSGRAVPLDTVNCLVPHGDEISLMEIAVLLNSRFASWYATRFIFADAQRTMHFDARYVGRIPVPDFRSRALPEGPPPNRPSHVQLQELVTGGEGMPELSPVDSLVYGLFDLNEDERAEIDSYFPVPAG